MSHFKLISTTKASEVIPINKYVSEKTGITVIIANVEGPLVNGFFCLATEADDDDGLPHTLEHLIFLGSERYPYKGILDLLANRCMAHGTNAWTDTDHTCYTIDTAGDEGMLALLPIYLDHILRPTLTEHAFITEVHHIDGDGEDSGVVYCEMQGRENSADSRCELRLLRALYPGNAYSAQTGGIMHNLRTSTDNKKVIDFHKRFYRAENLTIILTGQIKADDVFKVLAVVEDDILAKREKESPEPWVKPFQTIPPPANFGEYTEQWPCDTEDCGQIVFGWRGPNLTESSSQTELSAVAIIQRYLCETASAPLQKALVEREDALAGDVSYNITENLVAAIKIECDNVPIAKLTACRDEALSCLKRVRDGDEPIDMERLRRLTRKQIRETMASLEADPHHAVAFRAIGDAIYSQNEEDFINRMNPQISLQELINKNEAYWRGLMQKYFTDDIVVIMGSPSVELQAKMAEEEKKRIEEQRALLGEAGLAKKAKLLEDAMAYNERPPPDGTLRAFPVPSCTSLKFHNIASWHSGGDTCPHMDLSKIPLYTRLHSLSTNFVYINIILDTTSVDVTTRKWLPIHMNGLAECPVIREGKLIPHEEVISTTERLTVMFANNIGFGKSGNFSVGSFGNLLHIETRCEPADYDEVVHHLSEILFSVEITKERLLVFAQRMLNDIAQVRRNGHKMVYDLLRDSLYSTDSNLHWNSVLRQTKFLKELIDRLNAGGDSAQSVIQEAKETLRKITANAWLHMASDFERYKLSADPWKVFNKGAKPVKEPTLYNDKDLMSKFGGGFVVGVGGVESTFLNQFSPGPPEYGNEVVAPLLLALNYFTQLEGPMWRLIRGSGLSYGYGIRHLPNEASLVFSLYRATNAIAAYNKVKTIVDDFLKGGEFDEDLFASAKSTALFEVVEYEKCPADVVNQSLINFVKQVSNDNNRELICAIASVTPKEARDAAEKWLPSVFEADKSKVSIVCHPTKVKDIQAAFEKVNVKLEAYESLEQTHYNQ